MFIKVEKRLLLWEGVFCAVRAKGCNNCTTGELILNHVLVLFYKIFPSYRTALDVISKDCHENQMTIVIFYAWKEWVCNIMS
ncbi:hypothetical protein DET56_11799 [Paenibacillus pabuli]|uniref:Uncharacterized protein n=1 Tax=Paenibacillus pabuli TaxID=1472 RepID=A0A855XLG9_9BACL|nr:hypothetical protein DET56_11799 [Paenibacillus pabuli]PXW00019.1 hypothetical protein DEU73_11698 [Paenibacillus taichungensis]